MNSDDKSAVLMFCALVVGVVIVVTFICASHTYEQQLIIENGYIQKIEDGKVILVKP
jgi:hypothetical protein